MGFELSGKTARKLKAMLAKGQTTDQGGTLGGGTARQSCHVLITGERVEGCWYPAVVTEWHSSDQVWVVFEGTIYVKEPHDVPLETGKRYMAYHYGEFPEEFPRYYTDKQPGVPLPCPPEDDSSDSDSDDSSDDSSDSDSDSDGPPDPNTTLTFSLVTGVTLGTAGCYTFLTTTTTPLIFTQTPAGLVIGIANGTPTTELTAVDQSELCSCCDEDSDSDDSSDDSSDSGGGDDPPTDCGDDCGQQGWFWTDGEWVADGLTFCSEGCTPIVPPFPGFQEGTHTTYCCGGTPPDTGCCPDATIPTTLFGTVTNVVGDCSCIPTSYTFVKDGEGWYTEAVINCQEGITDFLTLACQDDEWHLSITCFNTATLVSFTCSPFSIVFDVSSPAGNQPATCCPTTGGSFRLTITE